MMGPKQVAQASLFYRFSVEDHVPGAHLLRPIDRFVDLSDSRRFLAPHCSSTGRPSIDPGLMIRMLIVGYCVGDRATLAEDQSVQDFWRPCARRPVGAPSVIGPRHWQYATGRSGLGSSNIS